MGSNIAVSLTRAGIGTLIMADFDLVEASNLNRQHYFLEDVGKPKVKALANHLRAINPNISLSILHQRLTASNMVQLFKDAEILIEAFDKPQDKVWLIETWSSEFPQRPIICGSGLSGIGNIKALKVRNIGNIFICGDEKTDLTLGLCSARIAVVANMQASTAIELLIKDSNDL